ncbi:MAG: aminotransferase class III-fold pyridoxal phosphate-dependent enzyme [Acidobacteria bacterium]|nr:aminotransferase class III-fold pyridoxal phosphate-dependent enzyme [Acidobacteriota bacterium]
MPSASAPVLTASAAERLALAEFQLASSAAVLNAEYDSNFHLRTQSGDFVLKAMHPGWEPAVVDMQAQALLHLERRGVDAPRVIHPPRPVDGRLIWLLSYVPGRVFATVRPHTADLLEGLGRLLGRYDKALSDFDHPAADRDLKWDLSRANWALGHLPAADEILLAYEQTVQPRLASARRQVLHNDANDHNVIVAGGRAASLIDFGDMLRAPLVCEVAIAGAYALMGQTDPLGALRALVAGYHAVMPLDDEELSLVFPLMQARLAVSVVNSHLRARTEPDNEYLRISEQPAWDLLSRLRRIHPRLAHYHLRAACGKPVVPPAMFPRGVVPVETETGEIDASPTGGGFTATGIGRYNEPRLVYVGLAFQRGTERRTIHLGLDFFAPAGTPVKAALRGVIHAAEIRDANQDYGGVAVLRHEGFFTLYGHLSAKSVRNLQPGAVLEAGEVFAELGTQEENGGWLPHLHFQILMDGFDDACAQPGVAFPSERLIWNQLSPDPNRLLGLPIRPCEEQPMDLHLARRKSRIGPNLSVSYAKPIRMARGSMQYLYDTDAQQYLDLYNNVPHVGHCHPRVVDAVQHQLALLNTNTRYLNDALLAYADRLTATLPPALSVVYLTASGSEANELAIRMARACTGRVDVAVMAGGYHGHTTAMIDLSEYKFAGPGGAGQKPWVRLVPVADPYRNPSAAFPDVSGAAAFLCESFPSVGGQIVFPGGYLRHAYSKARAAGAVCIADEVQTGFGRLGSHFWGFDYHGAVPDIVVLGKPIGNGYPMGAVVTTREIADAFANGMEWFSTFGGSHAACAAGLAVLDVLERENLQAHAGRIGAQLLKGLRELQLRHEIIGDVRGSGLFLGVEFVKDRQTKEPAAADAARIVNRLREHNILLGTDGPLHNVIKLRGPLPVSADDASRFLEVFDALLHENL